MVNSSPSRPLDTPISRVEFRRILLENQHRTDLYCAVCKVAGELAVSQQVYRGIQLGDGEEIVRDYHAAVQRRPKIDIFVAVTTRRLLSAGESKGLGGGAIFMSEAYIQDIGGITALYGGGFDIARLITGFIVLFIGIGMMFLGGILFAIGILFLLGGLYVLYTAIVGRGRVVTLDVLSKGGSVWAVSLGASTTRSGPSLSSLGLGGVRQAYVKPGPDAEKMVRELSACVMDLQSDRENALRKWRQESPQSTNVEAELTKLKTLHDSGAITDAEYEDQRKKILSRM